MGIGESFARNIFFVPLCSLLFVMSFQSYGKDDVDLDDIGAEPPVTKSPDSGQKESKPDESAKQEDNKERSSSCQAFLQNIKTKMYRCKNGALTVPKNVQEQLRKSNARYLKAEGKVNAGCGKSIEDNKLVLSEEQKQAYVCEKLANKCRNSCRTNEDHKLVSQSPLKSCSFFISEGKKIIAQSRQTTIPQIQQSQSCFNASNSDNKNNPGPLNEDGTPKQQSLATFEPKNEIQALGELAKKEHNLKAQLDSGMISGEEYNNEIKQLQGAKTQMESKIAKGEDFFSNPDNADYTFKAPEALSNDSLYSDLYNSDQGSDPNWSKYSNGDDIVSETPLTSSGEGARKTVSNTNTQDDVNKAGDVTEAPSNKGPQEQSKDQPQSNNPNGVASKAQQEGQQPASTPDYGKGGDSSSNKQLALLGDDFKAPENNNVNLAGDKTDSSRDRSTASFGDVGKAPQGTSSNSGDADFNRLKQQLAAGLNPAYQVAAINPVDSKPQRANVGQGGGGGSFDMGGGAPAPQKFNAGKVEKAAGDEVDPKLQAIAQKKLSEEGGGGFSNSPASMDDPFSDDEGSLPSLSSLFGFGEGDSADEAGNQNILASLQERLNQMLGRGPTKKTKRSSYKFVNGVSRNKDENTFQIPIKPKHVPNTFTTSLKIKTWCGPNQSLCHALDDLPVTAGSRRSTASVKDKLDLINEKKPMSE